MIWLTWRHMRAQTLWTAAALTAAGAYLLYLAWAIRDAHRTNVTDCTANCDNAARILNDQFGPQLLLIGLALIAGPALIGAFWGAPLITRELETGTHRLAWTQSVTRTRWLTVKLAVVGTAALALTAALSLMLTWAAGPYDDLVDGRFEPLTFAARGLAPLGYAVLAFTLGVTIGILARKTLLAMALTLTAFVLFQFLMANVARPNFAEPVTATIDFTDAHQIGEIDMFGIGPEGARIHGYAIPGAWVLSDDITVYKGDGAEVTETDLDACDEQHLNPDECLAALDADFEVTYQPADRYWDFQWIELGTALALSAALTATAYWRLGRGLN